MERTASTGSQSRSGAHAAALLLGVVVAAAPMTAMAAPVTRWVRGNAPNGYAAPGTNCGAPGYPTIQSAINAASAGDTVDVCPGTYVENVVVNKASLRVQSVAGPQATTIRSHVSVAVVTITQPFVSLEGFTLRPAAFAKYDIGVNVAIDGDASAEIAHNVIARGRIGINLGCASSATTIYRNVVSGATEAGINVDTCEIDPFPGSDDNSVHHNVVCGGLYPYSIAVGGSASRNHVHHNTGRWISAGGQDNHVHHNVAEFFSIAAGNVASDNTVADVCR